MYIASILRCVLGFFFISFWIKAKRLALIEHICFQSCKVTDCSRLKRRRHVCCAIRRHFPQGAFKFTEVNFVCTCFTLTQKPFRFCFHNNVCICFFANKWWMHIYIYIYLKTRKPAEKSSFFSPYTYAHTWTQTKQPWAYHCHHRQDLACLCDTHSLFGSFNLTGLWIEPLKGAHTHIHTPSALHTHL